VKEHIPSEHFTSLLISGYSSGTHIDPCQQRTGRRLAPRGGSVEDMKAKAVNIDKSYQPILFVKGPVTAGHL